MNPCVLLAALLAVFVSAAAPLAAADTRAEFLKLIDRPRVPLAAEIKTGPSAPAGFIRLDFTYAADADNRVPGILLKSSAASGRRPVVIVLHGTGGTKENELPFMAELARAGFIAVAIDGR
jgi:cephalosporin-C deacetylase-like acetyl esterase